MLRLLTMIGLAAAAVLIGASATMNCIFASSLGKTPFEGYVLGVVSVAVDVLKALLAVFVAKALRDGQRGFVVIGGASFLLFSIGSFVAAAGFASTNRGAVTEGRRAAAQLLVETEQDLTRARDKRATLPNHRSAPIVEAVLAGLQIDARWNASRRCAAPATSGQRDLCSQVSALKIELAAAQEADRLDGQIVVLRERVTAQRGNGNGEAADPQVRFLAESVGLNESTVQRLLMSMLALIVEVSSALGVYLVTGHGPIIRAQICGADAERASTATPVVEALDATGENAATSADISNIPEEVVLPRSRARASIALARNRPPKQD